MLLHSLKSTIAGKGRRGDVPKKAGFTLVEILIVITVILLLLTIAGSTAGGMLDTLRMKEGMETLRNTMDQARQTAMTLNREVIVRIYKAKNEMGDEAWRGLEYGVVNLITNPDDPKYVDPTAAGYKPKFERLGTIQRLPAGLVFHPSPTYSLLIDPAQPDLEKGREEGPDGEERDYVSFTFSPDGSCNLPPTKKWTLTLLKESDLTEDAALPPNYAAMQLYPATARMRIYRP